MLVINRLWLSLDKMAELDFVLSCTRLYFLCFDYPPLFLLTTNSLSLRKASHSNPHPTFSNCMQNNVTSVPVCLTTFCKKQLYTTCLTWVVSLDLRLTKQVSSSYYTHAITHVKIGKDKKQGN